MPFLPYVSHWISKPLPDGLQIEEQRESGKSASLPVCSHSERFYPFPLFVDERVGYYIAVRSHPLQEAREGHN